MDYFPTHSPLHVTYIQLGVGVSLVVLEEHVSYNDSQSAYNPTTNVIRKIQNKERIGKKIAIRVGELYGWRFARTHSCAASQLAVGFIIIGPAPRNPQLIRFALSSCLKTLSSRLNTKKGFRNFISRNPFYYVNAMRRCRLHSFVLLLNDNLACCTVRELEDVDALNRSRNL